MARKISNYDDVIDSRDIIERIEELPNPDNGEEITEAEQAELNALMDLSEEGQHYSDWVYGATLIRDSYFETYTHELAEEVGAIDGNERWPLNCIDWERAARELKYDYDIITFDGVDYWIHN